MSILDDRLSAVLGDVMEDTDGHGDFAARTIKDRLMLRFDAKDISTADIAEILAHTLCGLREFTEGVGKAATLQILYGGTNPGQPNIDEAP